MAKIKVVTDSTADIPPSLAKELGITVIPLKVIFSEDEMYEDGVNLTADAFYKKVAEVEQIPTTSQPTPHQFEEAYETLQDGETEILSIHLSSKMSGTYQAARIAREGLENHKDLVHVIDSRRASYSVGMIVVEIARMAKRGESLTNCLARLGELLNETSVYFMVDTLEYLQKNGRIGKASALLGSILKIKPILSVTEEGEVYSYEKVRGQKRAFNRLITTLKEKYGDSPVHLGISHAVNEELAEQFLAQLLEDFSVQSHVVTSIGAVIGSHVGPGTVSIAMTYAKE